MSDDLRELQHLGASSFHAHAPKGCKAVRYQIEKTGKACQDEARGLEQSCTSRRTPQMLATELTGFWRSFNKALFDPYRPEGHYMRGLGPGWYAKHCPSRHAVITRRVRSRVLYLVFLDALSRR